MPKVNIYLPDDLFERVKQFKLPVSSICQTALSDVLMKVLASVEAEEKPGEFSVGVDTELPLGYHVRKMLIHAGDAAAKRGSPTLEPEDFLQGILDEGESLLLTLLEQLGFTRRRWQRELNSVVVRQQTALPVASVVLSAQTKAFILQADADAQTAKALFINGAHVFFAMADQEDSVAAKIIQKMGVKRILNREIMALIDAGNAFGKKEAVLSEPEKNLQVWMQRISGKLDQLERRLDVVAPEPSPFYEKREET